MGLYDRDYMRGSAPRKPLPQIVVTLSIVVALVVATSYLIKELRLFSRTSQQTTIHEPSQHEKLLKISPLDLNTATHSELCLLPHVSETMATEIMGTRPLFSIDQLDDVYGIGEKKLAGIRPHVFVDETTLKQRFPDQAKRSSDTLNEQH